MKIAEQWARISELRTENKELKNSLRTQEKSLKAVNSKLSNLENAHDEARRAPKTNASFEQGIFDLRRTTVALRSIDREMAHPLRKMPFKLRNYSLAQSHGVQTPNVFATWVDARDIDVSELPDQFVVKTDGGAGGHGVLPLTRIAPDSYREFGTGKVRSGREVREHFIDRPRTSGPYFAEELLTDHAGKIPNDIKIFAFYGKIAYIQLINRFEHKTPRFHFISSNGESLNDDIIHSRNDSSIPIPDTLSKISKVSEHLSRAIGLPFARIDLYNAARGIVLGEITRGPGLSHKHSPDFDIFVGELYEEARLRLETDVANGRPFGVLHGNTSFKNHYPQEEKYASAPWQPLIVPCTTWCEYDV